MKRLSNEIWTKWSILENKNLSHDKENILLNRNGLFIKLYNVGNTEEKDIIVKFRFFIAYRITRHYYKEAYYQDLIKRSVFNGEWGSYIVKNSRWVEELTRYRNTASKNKEDCIHYAVIEEDYAIEVVSILKPKIEFISTKE